MDPKLFKQFYEAIPSKSEKNKFREFFLAETKLSYPTFHAYKGNNKKVIPFMAAEKIKELALILQPTLYNQFFKEEA